MHTLLHRSYTAWLILLCVLGLNILQPVHADIYLYNPKKIKLSDALLIDWIDLIPEEDRKLFNNKGILLELEALGHEGDFSNVPQPFGRVRENLNGSLVTLPGFVIPLSGNKDELFEILLVPYLGACIHVPPPPTNQIVYIRFEKPLPVAELWDIVNVTGILTTESSKHELAETGYLMQGIRVTPYEDSSDEYY